MRGNILYYRLAVLKSTFIGSVDLSDSASAAPNHDQLLSDFFLCFHASGTTLFNNLGNPLFTLHFPASVYKTHSTPPFHPYRKASRPLLSI